MFNDILLEKVTTHVQYIGEASSRRIVYWLVWSRMR